MVRTSVVQEHTFVILCIADMEKELLHDRRQRIEKDSRPERAEQVLLLFHRTGLMIELGNVHAARVFALFSSLVSWAWVSDWHFIHLKCQFCHSSGSAGCPPFPSSKG